MRYKLFLSFLFLTFALGAGLKADPPQPKVMNFIAVIDLKCGTGIEKDVCKSLTDVAISELVKVGKYTVIDRANRDKILSEQGFQQTGCVEDICTVEAGRLLGVGKIVVGSVTKIGQTYLVDLQLINVQTASVETTADEECKCELDGLIQSVRNAARKLMSIAPATPAVVTPPVAPTQTKSVKAIETAKLANSGLFPSYQPNKAMVIFYRAHAFKQGGPWKSIIHDIHEGDKSIGELGGGQYFYYETEPGWHNFSAQYATWFDSSGDIQLFPGKTIFIKIVAATLYLDMEPDIALAEALKCKYVKPVQ